MPALQRIRAFVQRESLLLGFGVIAVVLECVDPVSWRQLAGWSRPETLTGLLGLMLAIQGIRQSGLIPWLAHRLVLSLASRRALGMALVLTSALASMLLTNDVSLFLLVPLTLVIAGPTQLPAWRLVSLEALAVNAGSALSPIGNPQNLLLLQQSGLGIGRFTLGLLPSALTMLLLVMVFSACWLPGGKLTRQTHAPEPKPVKRPMAGLSLLALAGMVISLSLGHPGWGCTVILALVALLAPRMLARIDWLLLASFLAIFVALGHLAALPLVHAQLARLDLQQPLTLYLSGILTSQIISNVPAAVLLLSRHPDPVALAVAVNVGGFGMGIGSMANLIAWRIAGIKDGLSRFHRVSIPFLLLTAPLVYGVQRVIHSL
ncbi:SLC13 family permease [Frateuria aurantia]